MEEFDKWLEELIDKDNIKIKSIIIEKLDFNTIISNNIDPYEYDENKKYRRMYGHRVIL